MAINLLPTDLTPKGPVVKLANTLKLISYIAFSVLVITGIGLIAFFVINSLSIRSTNSQNEELKTSIESLEETEQGIVLVKDRLNKAKSLLGEKSGREEAQALSNLMPQIGADATLIEAIVDKAEFETTFVTLSSSVLSQLMATVVVQDTYKGIELISFSYNPNAGYVVGFKFLTE